MSTKQWEVADNGSMFVVPSLLSQIDKIHTLGKKYGYYTDQKQFNKTAEVAASGSTFVDIQMATTLFTSNSNKTAEVAATGSTFVLPRNC